MSEVKMVMIHPLADVEKGAEIGDGTQIWRWTHVMSGARIGQHCTLGQNVFVMSGAVIGDRVKIQNNVSVFDGVVIQDDVFVGPSVVFTNVRTPRSHVSRRNEFSSTLVKQGATLGANATLVCPVTVGEFAMVGAGAVVNADVPDYGLVVGVPARLLGWVCECGDVLPDRRAGGTCARCGKIYRF
jgi:UDP-2-acetamido-3-amino-2,3-dideoxy-glucuronate N-acetyltransferase